MPDAMRALLASTALSSMTVRPVPRLTIFDIAAIQMDLAILRGAKKLKREAFHA